MPAKLLITREDDFNWKEEMEFNQDIITIGRSNSNVLILNDQNRVVSRNHAKIKLQNGSYYVEDCESRNATYLNNKKLPSNNPQLLKEGDIVKVGDYNLHCELLTADIPSPVALDSTVLLVNAFDEDMRIFAGLMNKIKRAYDSESDASRDEQLRIALYRTLTFLDLGEVGDIFAEALFNKGQRLVRQPVIQDVKAGLYETAEQKDVEPKKSRKKSNPALPVGAASKKGKNERPSLISLYQQRKNNQRRFH